MKSSLLAVLKEKANEISDFAITET